MFGQRFRKDFPSVERHIQQVGDFAEGWLHDTVVESEGGFVTKQEARGDRTPELHEVKVNVGAKCNGGWMAEYDRDAVTVIKALKTRTGRRTPTPTQAKKLALWLVKMGMAYDLYQPRDEKAYTDALRHALFASRGLPAGTNVYMGYEPSQPDWLSFWQRGWHVAPFDTPAEHVVYAEPNLSTTFFGMEGLRLVAHRIAPEVDPLLRHAAVTLLRDQMVRSGMVPIAPTLAKSRLQPMDERGIALGMYAVQAFVAEHTQQMAPHAR